MNNFPESLTIEGGDPTAVGRLAVCGGQAYITTGMRDYLRKDGTSVPAIGLKTACPVCEAFFETVVPFIANAGATKRCEECRKTGGMVFSKAIGKLRHERRTVSNGAGNGAGNGSSLPPKLGRQIAAAARQGGMR